MSDQNKNKQGRESYPTDLTDAQWHRIQSHLPKPKSNQQIGGRPLEVDFREIVNACLYQVRSGGAWRMLPHDFPKWKIVYHYFDAWKKDGAWEKIHDKLRQAVRVKAGKRRKTSAGIIDAQSVQTTKKGEFVALMPVKR
jgi:transposase